MRAQPKDIPTVKPSVLVTASLGVEVAIAHELKARGFSVKILARNAKKVQNFTAENIDIIEAVATLPKTLEGTLFGIQTIISTISLSQKEKGVFDSIVDYQSNINLLQEAKRAAVQKFIFIAPTHNRRQMNPNVLRAYENFMTLLHESGIAYAIVRADRIHSNSNFASEIQAKRKFSFFKKKIHDVICIHKNDLAIACAEAIKVTFPEVPIRSTI